VGFPQDLLFYFFEEIMKTFREWMPTNFDLDDLRKILSICGCRGFYGRSHFYKIHMIYQEFHEGIWDIMGADADENEMVIPTFISKCLDAEDVCSEDAFIDLLVRYAVKKVANEIISQDED
jgi:hypothetical protein